VNHTALESEVQYARIVRKRKVKIHPVWSKQTRKATTAFFIQRHEHAVDRPMFFGHSTVRMCSTGSTSALVFDSLRLAFHALILTVGLTDAALGPTCRI